MANTNPRNLVSLSNLMMQARKNCNHPFLFRAPQNQEGEWLVDERFVSHRCFIAFFLVHCFFSGLMSHMCFGFFSFLIPKPYIPTRNPKP